MKTTVQQPTSHLRAHAGVRRSAISRFGITVARVWRDTDYANRRVIELQRPWQSGR